jgi:hypothetical protein
MVGITISVSILVSYVILLAPAREHIELVVIRYGEEDYTSIYLHRASVIMSIYCWYVLTYIQLRS